MGRIPPYIPPQPQPFGRMQPGQRGPQGTNPEQEQQQKHRDAATKFEGYKASQAAKITAHENAHKAAAGKFGGSIHYDYDKNGVMFGGHVPISMPGLNPANPEQTVNDAKVVFGAAVAPGADASGQDMAVASQAQAIMGQAQVLMAMKNKKPPKQ